MSREDLRNFVKAIEHNVFVREKLNECKTANDLIILAKNFGYTISFKDFKYDKAASEYESWFKESKIGSLKYWT